MAAKNSVVTAKTAKKEHRLSRNRSMLRIPRAVRVLKNALNSETTTRAAKSPQAPVKHLKMNRLPIYALLLTAALSCGITGSRGNGDDNYFSSFHTFADQRWDYARPLEFTVDTLRDSVVADGVLLLSLRHTSGYEYSNLWLELSYADTDSTVRRDTLNIGLADAEGHWLGHGTGPSRQLTDTIARRFSIHKGETLELRMDTLPNIEQIGIVFLPKTD